MRPLPLVEVHDEHRFGGKASQLGHALRARLPVPDGVGLSVELVDRLACGDRAARATTEALFEQLGGGPVAVRSSAVGEDSAGASFAGQHLTRLNVCSRAHLTEAVHAVWASGRTDAALAYRRRLGLEARPQVAVVVQRMVVAECAGVMFTKNPVDGADERVIEVTWGLGEAVVAGLVDPDRVRMRRGGVVVQRTVGEKDVAVRAMPEGHTEELPVAAHLVHEPCLDDARLAQLEELASSCEAVFEGAHDIEFAFDGPSLFLLQRRAVTR